MNKDIKFIKDKIKKLKLFPKKKLGQHFLINSQIIQKIILAVKHLKPTEVIEIGPGWGALTKSLIQLKKPLRVIETDKVLVQYWRSQNIAVIEDSALQINWHPQSTKDGLPTNKIHLKAGKTPPFFNPKGPKDPKDPKDPKSSKDPKDPKDPKDSKGSKGLKHLCKNTIDIKNGTVLVGNLPFNIASRLLVQLCPGPPSLKAMVFMFQKEVAQRILSSHKCKTYGILSVLSQCFWDTKLLQSVGKSDFYPRPQVAGQVLIFKQKKHGILNPNHFLSFVKFCFSQRRKTLFTRLCRTLTPPNNPPFANNTLSVPPKPKGYKINITQNPIQKTKFKPPLPIDLKPEQYLINLFNKMNINRLARAEALSPLQFKKLFNNLQKNGYCV